MASRYDWRRLLITVVVPVYGMYSSTVYCRYCNTAYSTPGLSGLRAAIRTGARRLRVAAGPLIYILLAAAYSSDLS